MMSFDQSWFEWAFRGLILIIGGLGVYNWTQHVDAQSTLAKSIREVSNSAAEIAKELGDKLLLMEKQTHENMAAIRKDADDKVSLLRNSLSKMEVALATGKFEAEQRYAKSEATTTRFEKVQGAVEKLRENMTDRVEGLRENIKELIGQVAAKS